MTHRRRALFLLLCFCLRLVSNFSLLFGFATCFSGLGSVLGKPSLPAQLPVSNIVTSPLLELQREADGSEPLSGNSRRSLTWCSLKSVSNFGDAGESCKDTTTGEVTTSSDHKPAATKPPQRKLLRLSERKLGFPDLDLPKCGPLCLSSWPIFRCGGKKYLSSRPRFDPISILTFPCVLISPYNSMIGRGLLSSLVPMSIQGTVDFSLAFLHQVQSLDVCSHRISLNARTLPLGPSVTIRSVSSSTAHEKSFSWSRSVFTTLLSDSSRLMFRRHDCSGRGHHLSLLSIALRWLDNRCFRILSLSIHQVSRAESINSRLLVIVFPISSRFWFENSPKYFLNHVYAKVETPMLQLSSSSERTLCPIPSFVADSTCLTPVIYETNDLLVTPQDVYLFTLPNYSFKRRIQISSLWERSFSHSVPKAIILPPFFSLGITFPPHFSATENVVKRSKVLKTLRAICVVRSPLMAEELDFDFKSIIYETFWQKFPVFIYDDYRYSILYLLCSLIYVTSESYSLAKSFPLVT